MRSDSGSTPVGYAKGPREYVGFMFYGNGWHRGICLNRLSRRSVPATTAAKADALSIAFCGAWLNPCPTDCLNVSAASSHIICSSIPRASHDEHSAAEQAASEGLDGAAPRRSDAAASAIGSAEAIRLELDSPDSATVQIGRGASEYGGARYKQIP